MLKKTIFAGLAVASLAAPSIANEKDNAFYLTVGGGYSFVDDVDGDTTITGTKYDLSSDMDDAFNWNVGLGKHFNGKWRLEYSYGHFQPKMTNVTATTGGTGATASISPKPEFEIKSHMFNIYRDFRGFPIGGNKLTPYVGAGIGSTNVKMKNYTTTVAGTAVSVTDNGRDLTSWSVKGGLNYAATTSTDLYTEVSYNGLSNFSEDNINYDSLSDIKIMGGLRYKF